MKLASHPGFIAAVPLADFCMQEKTFTVSQIRLLQTIPASRTSAYALHASVLGRFVSPTVGESR